jgi:hypothetical protein
MFGISEIAMKQSGNLILHIRIFRYQVTTARVLYQIVHMQLQLFAARSIVVQKM